MRMPTHFQIPQYSQQGTSYNTPIRRRLKVLFPENVYRKLLSNAATVSIIKTGHQCHHQQRNRFEGMFECLRMSATETESMLVSEHCHAYQLRMGHHCLREWDWEEAPVGHHTIPPAAVWVEWRSQRHWISLQWAGKFNNMLLSHHHIFYPLLQNRMASTPPALSFPVMFRIYARARRNAGAATRPFPSYRLISAFGGG